MKNINFKLSVVFQVLLLCAAAAWAAPDPWAGTSASAFLKLGTGAPAAQALGNAFTASGSGAQALFWNPAGAAAATTRQVQVSHMKWFEGVGDSAVAYIQPMGRTVLGVTARYLRLGSLDNRNEMGIPQDYSGDIMKDLVASVSLARTFFTALDLGATAKYINENNAGTRHINAAFDLGARLRLFNDKIMFGLMGQNLGDSAEVPTAVRGGAAFNTKYFSIGGELVDYADDKMRYGIGLALHIPEDIVQVATFDIRLGYYNRESTGAAEEGSIPERIGLENTSKVTLGFGFYSSEVLGYGLGLDYAMMPSGALGTAHQIAVRLEF
ncbi:MAG: hypothetical protein LBR90_01550 [Elusimicrobiota bacterium]|jgi:hypothetical protein|nr:hypothetical protein [Elusimicrobiota bacterium]